MGSNRCVEGFIVWILSRVSVVRVRRMNKRCIYDFLLFLSRGRHCLTLGSNRCVEGFIVWILSRVFVVRVRRMNKRCIYDFLLFDCWFMELPVSQARRPLWRRTRCEERRLWYSLFWLFRCMRCVFVHCCVQGFWWRFLSGKSLFITSSCFFHRTGDRRRGWLVFFHAGFLSSFFNIFIEKLFGALSTFML
ncbi:hypothetical protein RM11_0989 [Bartonella quintana RM-11]|nr:hypothetical protein RM11_0989 [Bartonella quintana RM-11]